MRTYSPEKMKEFVQLLEEHAPTPGFHPTPIAELMTYRETKPQPPKTFVYEPAIVILGQGKKYCYLDGEKYDYSAGSYLSLFLPMPIQAEVRDVSEENPLLMAGIKVDLIKIANILAKMDQAGYKRNQKKITTSAIFVKPVTDDFLNPILKLLKLINKPLEQAILAEFTLEEIYFRLILNDHSGSLRALLQHRGQIQEISKVIGYIHKNISETVVVGQLADLINMSSSSFRKSFKQVMRMPPLQYAKSIKLNRAQMLIREGKNANEAGYLVGYNSPAQFSREYKRHFGYSPSATA